MGMKNMHTCATLENIKKVGVALRPSTPELEEYFLYLKKVFETENIEVLIEDKSADVIGIKGEKLKDLCEICDILISVGGDGTLISLARRSYPYKKPILGVNVGNLGFLTDIRKDELESFTKNYANKDSYRVDCRLMFEVSIEGDGGGEYCAFNDVVITRHHLTKMIHIKALFEENHFNTYYGDGIIISSPTGSTAYNISSGGPLIYPYSRTFVITPICPHSLFQRPLVLPADFEVEFEVTDSIGGVLVLDGQEVVEVKQWQKIKLKAVIEGAKLIHRTERDYFRVLKEKFKWGDV